MALSIDGTVAKLHARVPKRVTFDGMNRPGLEREASIRSSGNLPGVVAS